MLIVYFVLYSSRLLDGGGKLPKCEEGQDREVARARTPVGLTGEKVLQHVCQSACLGLVKEEHPPSSFSF